MGHGAGHRNAEPLSGEDVGGSVHSRDPEGASGVEGGVRAVHPTSAEVDDRTAPRRSDHAVGLGCQHGLQLDLVYHVGLDELRLGQWGLDLKDGLVRQYRGCLRAWREGTP